MLTKLRSVKIYEILECVDFSRCINGHKKWLVNYFNVLFLDNHRYFQIIVQFGLSPKLEP